MLAIEYFFWWQRATNRITKTTLNKYYGSQTGQQDKGSFKLTKRWRLVYWHWLSFLTGIGSSHVNLPSISGLLHKPPPTSHLQMFGQRLLPSEVVATGGGGQPLMTSGDKSQTASSLSPSSCQNVRTVWRHSLQSSITAIVLKFTAHHHRIFRKLFEIPHFVFFVILLQSAAPHSKKEKLYHKLACYIILA